MPIVHRGISEKGLILNNDSCTVSCIHVQTETDILSCKIYDTKTEYNYSTVVWMIYTSLLGQLSSRWIRLWSNSQWLWWTRRIAHTLSSNRNQRGLLHCMMSSLKQWKNLQSGALRLKGRGKNSLQSAVLWLQPSIFGQGYTYSKS